MGRDNILGIVTTPGVGRTMTRGSITGRGKILFSKININK